jgi:hypothetical protein
MRLLTWTLTQSDQCPYKKKKKFRHINARKAHTWRKNHVTTPAEGRYLQVRERDLRKIQTCQNLDLGLLASKTVRK